MAPGLASSTDLRPHPPNVIAECGKIDFLLDSLHDTRLLLQQYIVEASGRGNALHSLRLIVGATQRAPTRGQMVRQCFFSAQEYASRRVNSLDMVLVQEHVSYADDYGAGAAALGLSAKAVAKMLSGRIDNEPMWFKGTGTWSALYVVAPKHSRNVVLTLPANKTLVDRRVLHAAKADAALVGGLEQNLPHPLCAACRVLRRKGAAGFRGGESLETLRAEANAKS